MKISCNISHAKYCTILEHLSCMHIHGGFIIIILLMFNTCTTRAVKLVICTTRAVQLVICTTRAVQLVCYTTRAVKLVTRSHATHYKLRELQRVKNQ